MLSLQVALTGDLVQIMDDEVKGVGRALTAAVAATAKEAQGLLRRQIRQAGLGRKLEKSWQIRKYPARGRSLSPAALVFSKARRIRDAFEKAGTVRAKKANWLVIPMLPAVRQKFHLSQARSLGPRPRKWSEVVAAVERFGRMRSVLVDAKTTLLIADNATKTGRIRKGKRRKRDRGVVVFLLKKTVRSPKLLNSTAVRRRVPAILARNIANHLT
jgi:hypothetical protein